MHCLFRNARPQCIGHWPTSTKSFSDVNWVDSDKCSRTLYVSVAFAEDDGAEKGERACVVVAV